MKNRFMFLVLLAAVTLAAATVVTTLSGCGQGSPLNANTLGGLVGGNTGHLIKAGGHVTSSLAISEQDEDALGQAVGVRLTNDYGVVKDPQLQKYVSLVGLTVASASSEPGRTYVFGVLDSPTVNAFSGPHGYIFVTRGALAMMKDEAELAGVLSHEIAHVIHHDGLKQVQAAEQRGALTELAQANGTTAQFSALADAGVDVITKQGYSQPQEFSADEAGVQITQAAGYDPRSYLNFLQRLAEAQGGSNSNQLLSTHPGAAKRVGRVSEQLAKLPVGGATLADRFSKNVPH